MVICKSEGKSLVTVRVAVEWHLLPGLAAKDGCQDRLTCSATSSATASVAPVGSFLKTTTTSNSNLQLQPYSGNWVFQEAFRFC